MASLQRHIVKTLFLQYKLAVTPRCLKTVRWLSLTPHNHNRKYAEKHEWISVSGKIGTVGVSQYAQEALGDVVYVELPEVGKTVVKDGEAAVVESVKAVNELYSPVSGTVTEVNEQLTEKPNLINESCYDQGWVFKLELADPKELNTLMEEDEYEKYLKSIH